MRSIEVQEARRRGTQTKKVTYQVEGLKRRPCVWVQLTRGDVERLKGTHRKRVERKRTYKSEKRPVYMKKKEGSVDDRSRQTRSVNSHWPKLKKEALSSAFKIGTFLKNSEIEVSVRKSDTIPNILESTQASP